MRGVHSKIYKLTLALRQKGIIVKMNSEQRYSLKLDKVFTRYSIKETTVEEVKLRKIYYKKREEAKKDFSLLEEVQDLKQQVESMAIPVKEFNSKLDIMIYLAKRYKEVANG